MDEHDLSVSEPYSASVDPDEGGPSAIKELDEPFLKPRKRRAYERKPSPEITQLFLCASGRWIRFMAFSIFRKERG